MERIDCDVVIVGAGASGLTAATRPAARPAARVAVLEARDRVGGRLWTDDIDGAMLEIGGQWVSPDQDALIETLDDLGLETYPRYREGVNIYIGPDGEQQPFEGEIFPVAARDRAGDRRASSTSSTRSSPRSTPTVRGRTRRPRTSTRSRSRAGSRRRPTTRRRARTSACSSPAPCSPSPRTRSRRCRRCSWRHPPARSRTSSTPTSSSTERVVGGLQQVPLLLAERLGGDVRLGQPVRTLRWHPDAPERASWP